MKIKFCLILIVISSLNFSHYYAIRSLVDLVNSENNNLPFCRNNDYRNGRWVSILQDSYHNNSSTDNIDNTFYTNNNSSKKSFYCCDHSDYAHGQKKEECGLKNTDLGMLFYLSNDLAKAPDDACICDLQDGTRETKTKRESYRWETDSCQLIPWDGKLFCSLLKKKRILFVGDSLLHQCASTLYNMIKNSNGDCYNQISFGKSSHLFYQWPYKSGKNYRLDTFMEQNYGADIAIINTGAYISDNGDLIDIWARIEPMMINAKKKYNTTFVWTTNVYGHIRCEAENNAHIAYQPIKPVDYGIDKYNWRNFPAYDNISRDMAAMHNMPVVDIAPMISLRPDGHVGNRLAHKYDCLHYCMPGPLDLFPILLLNKMYLNEII